MKFCIISLVTLIIFSAQAISAPVAYWSFGEKSGRSLRDRSGNDNNGQIIGSPQWVKGKSGKALEFDGSNDFIIVPNNKSYNFGKSNSFSICFWINYSPKGDAQGILQKIDKTYAFDIGIQADNKLYFAVHDGSNLSKLILDDFSGGWHHCCFVRNTRTDILILSTGAEFQKDLDGAVISQELKQNLLDKGLALSDEPVVNVKDAGSEWQITSNQQTYKIRKEGDNLNIYTDAIYAYIDGKLSGKAEDKTSLELENNADMYIGARIPGNTMQFKGLLDELAIYNRVLTDQEISRAADGNMPEIYKESSLRRFEIVATSSIPFTAIYSYGIVRGTEMIIQGRVAPKFSNTNWNAMGGLTILFAGLVGFLDWVHTGDEDNTEVITSEKETRYSTEKTRYSMYQYPGLQFLSMKF